MKLTIEPLTPDAFAPFGDVIDTAGRDWFPINHGSTQRFHQLGEVQLDDQGSAIISIFRATPLALPLTITTLERHPLGSQAFVPLSDRPFLVVVAPTGELDPGQIRCFASKPHQGVNYHRSVWHHPVIALEAVSDFLIIDRAGPGSNCEVSNLPEGQQPIVSMS